MTSVWKKHLERHLPALPRQSFAWREEDEKNSSALGEQDMCSQTRDIHSGKVKVNDSMTGYLWKWKTSVCEECHPVCDVKYGASYFFLK